MEELFVDNDIVSHGGEGGRSRETFEMLAGWKSSVVEVRKWEMEKLKVVGKSKAQMTADASRALRSAWQSGLCATRLELPAANLSRRFGSKSAWRRTHR
jgi:hypothetical protein